MLLFPLIYKFYTILLETTFNKFLVDDVILIIKDKLLIHNLMQIIMYIISPYCKIKTKILMIVFKCRVN